MDDMIEFFNMGGNQIFVWLRMGIGQCLMIVGDEGVDVSEVGLFDFFSLGEISLRQKKSSCKFGEVFFD